MKAITGTLAGSAIPRLQVRSLCSDWGIGSDKLSQILNVMESVGILRIIRVENDTKAKSIGEKLFFSDPAYFPLLRGNPGTAREALVASLCADSEWTVEATKDETSGACGLDRRAVARLPSAGRLVDVLCSARPRFESSPWKNQALLCVVRCC